MNRAEALATAEALVGRIAPETSSSRPDRSTPPSLGDRISQILRVAKYLTEGETE